MAEAPQSTLTNLTGLLEKVSGAGLIALGLGFFIESYFDAQFGVTYLNPLHARLAFTGIGFLIQITLLALTFSVESRLRLSSSYLRTIAAQEHAKLLPWQRALYLWCWLLMWFLESVFLGAVMRVIWTASHFRTPPAASVQNGVPAAATKLSVRVLAAFRENATPLEAAFLAFVFLSIWDAIRHHRFARPWQRIAMLLLMSLFGLLLCIGFAVSPNKENVLFVIYVVAIRAGFEIMRKHDGIEPGARRLGIASLCITLPVFYAHFVYPFVLPQWGGPASTELWIRFEHGIVPFGCETPAYLLEETEEGYYLVHSRAEASAVPAQGASPAPSAGTSQVPPAAELDKCAVSRTMNVPTGEAYTAVFVPRSQVVEVIYRGSASGSR